MPLALCFSHSRVLRYAVVIWFPCRLDRAVWPYIIGLGVGRLASKQLQFQSGLVVKAILAMLDTFAGASPSQRKRLQPNGPPASSQLTENRCEEPKPGFEPASSCRTEKAPVNSQVVEIYANSQQRGSNQRPSAYEADALPLSYVGNCIFLYEAALML